MEYRYLGFSVPEVMKIIDSGNFNYAISTKIYNTIQQYKKALIIDLRCPEDFYTSHFFSSVNLPGDSFTVEELLHYDSNAFYERHFSKVKNGELFLNRKRLVVYIVPSFGCVDAMCDDHKVLTDILNSNTSSKIDFLRAKALVHAYILADCLRKEKVREVYIYINGFGVLLNRYPFLCLFCENHLYEVPY